MSFNICEIVPLTKLGNFIIAKWLLTNKIEDQHLLRKFSFCIWTTDWIQPWMLC